MTNFFSRWVVTDMDDTLIKHYGKVTPGVKKLWNKLSADPTYLMVVATGQSHVKVMEKFKANGLKFPHYIISNQGTVLYSPELGETCELFTLVYDDVKTILDHFFEIGGEEKYIRVCTVNKVIALDCDEARTFYKANPQGNVEFSTSLLKAISKTFCVKLVLSAPLEVVDKMLLYPVKNLDITVLNTGRTNYGGKDFYRYEIIAANKYLGLARTLEEWQRVYSYPINMICLGDEISDFGLAKFALENNSSDGSSGHFAIIRSKDKGNDDLTKNVLSEARNLGLENHVIFSPSVNDGGWQFSIRSWQEELGF